MVFAHFAQSRNLVNQALEIPLNNIIYIIYTIVLYVFI